MSKIANKNQQIISGVTSPQSPYSRAFGLACKASGIVGTSDFAYSPTLGNSFVVKGLSISWCGALINQITGGTILVSFGTGIPDAETVATRWENLVPFWAGTTKPSIQVLGQSGDIFIPMNRLFRFDALRFGMVIETGFNQVNFWVNAWFEISEG